MLPSNFAQMARGGMKEEAMITKLLLTVAGFVGDLRERARSERGAAAVEYGMLVALIAAVVVTTVALLGPKIRDAFQFVYDKLTGAGV
jgi:pilus assembly protein Flp/PilA